MPELPDLQVFRKNLEKKFGGKKLIKITVTGSKMKVKLPEAALKKLEGKKLKESTGKGRNYFLFLKGSRL